MNEDKNRIEWIDIAKGIGIIFVVLGHCVVKTDLIHKFIFSFHMPLFFILSGYCFHAEKYNKMSEVLKNRGKALLIPYCKFWLLGLIVTVLVPNWRNSLTIKGILTDWYLGYPETVHITSIWYLISLFGITVVYYILYMMAKATNKKCIIYIGIALSGIAGYSVYVVKLLMGVGDKSEDAASKIALPGGRLPLTIDASLMALVFFALGILVYKKGWIKNIKYKKISIVIGLLLVIAIGTFGNVRVNIHGCSYGNLIYFFTAALGGVIMVIAVGQWLSASKNSLCMLLKRIFTFYGKNSLFMFALQSLLIHLYVHVINVITDSEYELYENVSFQYGMLGFVIITFVCLPTCYWGYRCIKGFMVKENE